MFNWTESDKAERFPEMWELFAALGTEALSKSHYELYEIFPKYKNKTNLSLNGWRSFLKDPKVSKFIEEEFKTIANTELRKIVTDISDSNSIGTAQLLGQLAKITPVEDVKQGPAFVYCYVPPTEEEMKANILELEARDIFKKGGLHQ